MAQDRGLHPQARGALPQHRHWPVTLGRTACDLGQDCLPHVLL